MKLLFSFLWFALVIEPPPSVFAIMATTKKTTKHAKKNKTSDGFFPVFEPPIDNVGLDVTCNPSQADGLAVENGCEDDDCADPVWVTDAKHVCVSITVMPPGAMASEVIIMIITLTTIRRIHGVIPI